MLSLSRDNYNTLIKQAYVGEDEEICGILGGTYDADHSVVHSVHSTTNAAEQPNIRYHIDPEEQLSVIESIEAAGDDIVGFFHSHPAGPSNPSQTDEEQAMWPDVSYLIISLDGYPFVGSWRWSREENSFRQETLRIEE